MPARANDAMQPIRFSEKLLSSIPITRIALWSGPRNISTAMMRSWDSRADTVVCDEPLYAHYLRVTGIQHPGRDEILAHHEDDWRRVAEWLTGPVPEGRNVFYQKHMAHHLLPMIDREWVHRLRNGFLIRDPGEMLASLIQQWPDPSIADTGLPQQWELFQELKTRTGKAPPVLDARRVLLDPEAALRKLCVALDVPFDAAMLSWNVGPRDTDGVWARHWYGAVERSEGFIRYRPKDVTLPVSLGPLLKDCRHYYERLLEYAI